MGTACEPRLNHAKIVWQPRGGHVWEPCGDDPNHMALTRLSRGSREDPRAEPHGQNVGPTWAPRENRVGRRRLTDVLLFVRQTSRAATGHL